MVLPVKHVVIFASILSFGLCEDSNPYSFYLFENAESCVKTFNSELQLVQQLKSYRKLLNETKQLLHMFHHPKSWTNPIDSVLTLKDNFFNFKNALLTKFELVNAVKQQLELSLNLASVQDFHGALNGILLLQDTYEFDIHAASTSGNLEYFELDQNLRIIPGGEKLQKKDLIQLATLAQEKKLYDKAILFLKEATR